MVLPYYSKKDVYKDYVSSFNKHRPTPESKPLSYGSFRRWWKAELGYIKVSKTKTGWAACEECSHWRRMMREASTAALRAEYTSNYLQHLELQRKQRKKFYKHRQKAIDHPEKYLSIILDAMDQAKCDMLHAVRESKGGEKLLKLKQKLLAAMVHGVGTYVYIATTPVGSGANFNIEALSRTIEQVAAARGNRLPPIFYLQLDNASDNKSKAVLAFCDALVQMGVFKKIKIGFLMVGHTHEDIDQYFSVIARKLR